MPLSRPSEPESVWISVAKVLALGATALGMAIFFIWTRVRTHLPVVHEAIASVSYHPEHLGLSPSTLSASTDTIVATVFHSGRPDTLATIIWWLRPVFTAGSKRWSQGWSWTSRNGHSTVDTLVFDAVTFLPITEVAHRADTAIRLTYVDREVTLAIVVGDSTLRSNTFPLGFNPFANTQTRTVVAALPLAKGYTTEVPVVNLDSTFLRWTTIRVVGVDSVCGHGSHPDVCWIVDANSPRGRRYQRFWISQQSHQFVALVDRSFNPPVMYSHYYPSPIPSHGPGTAGAPLPPPATPIRSRFDSTHK